MAIQESLKNNNRCPWAGDTPIYIAYHDNEWGVPIYDDLGLFEFLILEGAQAGLSWITVLKKREAYRKALDGFNPAIIANYNSQKVDSLITDKELIRNRMKIESTIKNARAFLEIKESQGSFAKYIWRYTDGRSIINTWQNINEVPASTPLSEKISKELKKDGFSFVGPTIIYAFMQAVGMVNDHLVSCFRHEECSKYNQPA